MYGKYAHAFLIKLKSQVKEENISRAKSATTAIEHKKLTIFMEKKLSFVQ